MPFYYVFTHQNNSEYVFTNASQILREPMHGRHKKYLLKRKMSDHNMKCMETTQGSPVPVTGDLDPRMRWWVRLGSLLPGGPDQ